MTHASTRSDASGAFELRFGESGTVGSCRHYSLRGEGAGHYVESVQGLPERLCAGTVGGVVLRARLLIPPTSTLTFVSRPSNTQEECLARPPGTVCMGFKDDYIWLVEYPSPVRGHRSGGMYQGSEVAVYVFDGLELHHVLWTDLVAAVRF